MNRKVHQRQFVVQIENMTTISTPRGCYLKNDVLKNMARRPRRRSTTEMDQRLHSRVEGGGDAPVEKMESLKPTDNPDKSKYVFLFD